MPNKITDDRSPDQLREAMAQQLNLNFNEGIKEGLVVGAEPVPIQGIQPEPQEPVQPVPSGSEPPAEVAPTAPQEPTPKDDLVFGKYKDLEAAEKGYYHLNNTLSSVLQERDTLKSQLANGTTPQPAMIPGSSPGAKERVNPVQRTVDWNTNPTIVKAAEDMGIEPSALGQLAKATYEVASDELREEIKQEVQQEITPFHAAAEAETYMRTHYPEAYNYIPEIQSHLASDPEAQQIVGNLMNMGDHKGAYVYALKSFLMESGVGIQSQMRANSEVAEEERTKAREAANLPQSPGTPVHAAATNSSDLDEKDFETLKTRAQMGDTEAQTLLRRHAYGHMLPPSLRTWEG